MTLGLCGLLLVGGCFILASLNLRGLELRIQAPERFIAGRKVLMTAELWNSRKILSAWDTRVSISLPHGIKRIGFAKWLPANSGAELTQSVSIPSRGMISRIHFEFRSRFPFGIFEMRRTSSSSCSMIVYPRMITPAELKVGGSQSPLDSVVGIGFGDLFGEPRGTRFYQPGDKITRIHQVASARSVSGGREMQVRVYDPPGFHLQSCRIIFHSYAPAGEFVRLDRFERALSLVAGTLAYFQANRMKVKFQADFAKWRCFSCESRKQYHECLKMLAGAKRCRNTGKSDVDDVFESPSEVEQLIIISDSPPAYWIELIPPSRNRVMVINIREFRFKKRKMRLQPLRVKY